MTARTPDNRADGPPILLISCYELGHQPLAVAVPAGILRRAGFAVDVLDLAVQSLDEQKAATATFVGISTPMHTAMRIGVSLAHRVREINPTAHICFYGLYAELNREALETVADSVLGAEFESTIDDHVSSVLSSTPRSVDADSSTSGAQVRAGRDADLMPDRSDLSHDGYAKLVHNERVAQVGAVATTRGCKHLCTHCPLPASYGGRFYALPAQPVLKDIDALVASGSTHITFTDPDFLNGPTHALRICRELHAKHPTVTFDYTAKIEHLLRHGETVEELHDLGNIFVVTAVESLDETVLKHLAKGHTRADTLRAVEHFHRIGLALRPTFVPFTPWETGAGYLDILATIAEYGLVENVDPVQYSIRLLIPPGSLLLESDALAPHLGDYNADTLSWAWRHPDPAMDSLQVEVSRMVEADAMASIESTMTFDRIRARALTVLGNGETVEPYWGSRPRRTPPRLTEPWFC